MTIPYIYSFIWQYYMTISYTYSLWWYHILIHMTMSWQYQKIITSQSMFGSFYDNIIWQYHILIHYDNIISSFIWQYHTYTHSYDNITTISNNHHKSQHVGQFFDLTVKTKTYHHHLHCRHRPQHFWIFWAELFFRLVLVVVDRQPAWLFFTFVD